MFSDSLAHWRVGHASPCLVDSLTFADLTNTIVSTPFPCSMLRFSPETLAPQFVLDNMTTRKWEDRFDTLHYLRSIVKFGPESLEPHL